MRALKRFWCRLFHRRFSGFAWSPVLECRICGERFGHPALTGPVKDLPRPSSVRQVHAPKQRARVVKIAGAR